MPKIALKDEKEKRPLGRLRTKWKDKVKKDIEAKSVDWKQKEEQILKE